MHHGDFCRDGGSSGVCAQRVIRPAGRISFTTMRTTTNLEHENFK
jgi:hypothetical protein